MYQISNPSISLGIKSINKTMKNITSIDAEELFSTKKLKLKIAAKEI